MGILPGGYGQTSTVNPDTTVYIDVPEPVAALPVLCLLGLIRGRRRSGAAGA